VSNDYDKSNDMRNTSFSLEIPDFFRMLSSVPFLGIYWNAPALGW